MRHLRLRNARPRARRHLQMSAVRRNDAPHGIRSAVMKCDYSAERWGDDYCMLTDAKVSYDHYCDYCKRDNKESCPIYQYWQKHK